MPKLKVAFIGGGVDSAVGYAHKVAIEMDGIYELVAGCFSRDAEINKQTAIKYGIALERNYFNLTEMIKKEKKQIDAIVVLTPTPNHKEDILQCLNADIPVICEKALGTSVAEVTEIENILAKKKIFLAVTYNYTGYPMLRELKDFIKKGKLGNIEQIHIEMPQEGFIRLDKEGKPPIPQEWRLHDGILPTVSLDLGTHVHHIVNFLTGEKPVELVATQNHYGSFKQVVDNVICFANYTNSLTCNIWYGKTALGNRNGLRVRVYGTKGSAEWYQMDPEFICFSDNKGHSINVDRASVDVAICIEDRYNRFKAGHPAGYLEAFANHYMDIGESLYKYVTDKTFDFGEYVFGLDVAKEGLILLETIAKSATEKRWVNLDGL